MATALPDRALGTAAHRILAAVGDAGGSLTIQQIHLRRRSGPTTRRVRTRTVCSSRW